jgi:hypothetical protein
MMWLILVIRPFNHLLFRLSARQHEHVSNYFSRLSPHIVKSRGPIAKSPNPPRVPHPPTRSGPRLPRARVPCDCSSRPFHHSPPKKRREAARRTPRSHTSKSRLLPTPTPYLPRARGEGGPPGMAPAAAGGGAESQRQADLLKQEGNALFRKERLSAAIDAYTGVRRSPPLTTTAGASSPAPDCAACWFPGYACRFHFLGVVVFPLLFNRCAVQRGISETVRIVHSGEVCSAFGVWALINSLNVC